MVFARINSGGAKLQDQESRNAQYPGKFNDLIISLARNDYFCQIFDIPTKTKDEDVRNNVISDELRNCKDFSTMKDVEIVLRFFALRAIGLWDGTFSRFLDAFSECMTGVNQELLNEYKDLFEQTISLANSIFDDKTFCFWRRNKQTSTFSWTRKPTLFIYDTVMTSLSYFIDKKNQLVANRKKINADYLVLFENHENLFNGRNTSKKVVEERINLLKKFWKRYI